MNTGIEKYSRINNINEEQTQILITSNDEDGVNYTICSNWNPNQKVTFNDIMDVKVDLLGFEMMASPFLRKSVDMYAKNYESDSKDMNLFIFKKNKKIGVAVYKDKTNKEVLTLEKQFERLGL